LQRLGPGLPPSSRRHYTLGYGIGVCLGNGDGTFQPVVFYAAGSDTGIGFVVVGDFNGDHILDAATLGQQGVWLFRVPLRKAGCPIW
jgi:hypothetical protein